LRIAEIFLVDNGSPFQTHASLDTEMVTTSLAKVPHIFNAIQGARKFGSSFADKTLIFILYNSPPEKSSAARANHGPIITIFICRFGTNSTNV